ncbi:MAG: hypothetical protein ABWZ88_15920 [Variovorax sp.]
MAMEDAMEAQSCGRADATGRIPQAKPLHERLLRGAARAGIVLALSAALAWLALYTWVIVVTLD